MLVSTELYLAEVSTSLYAFRPLYVTRTFTRNHHALICLNPLPRLGVLTSKTPAKPTRSPVAHRINTCRRRPSGWERTLRGFGRACRELSRGVPVYLHGCLT